MTSKKLSLTRAAIALAHRSESTKWEARLQHHADRAEALLKRSWLQSKGAVRLLKIAEGMA